MMFIPNLGVPPIYDKKPDHLPKLRPDLIKSWIRKLPAGNHFDTLVKVVDLLTHMNRVEISRKDRFNNIRHMAALIETHVPPVRQEYLKARLPLSARNRQRHNLLKQLWIELAYCYKSIIMDILLREKLVTNPRAELIPATVYAIDALTNLLLEAYITFSPEPKQVWEEINELYFFAETNSIASEPFEKRPRDLRTAATVKRSFCRALLISLADPYHLMPGEIHRLAEEMASWRHYCDLEPITEDRVPAQNFFIDLSRDYGPAYLFSEKLNVNVKRGRKIHLEEALAEIENISHQLALADLDAPTDRLSLDQRLRRDLYVRVKNAWEPRPLRKARRLAVKSRITLAAGLAACHYFINDEQPFDREALQEKISALLPRDHEASQARSSLVDSLTWDSDDDGGHFFDHPAAHAVKKTQPFAATVGNSDNDIWNRVYQRGALDAEFSSPRSAGRSKTHCEVKDASSHGLAIAIAANENEVITRVGDLLVYQSAEELRQSSGDETWSVGTVRWLRAARADRLELGIQILAENAWPVAIQVVEGTTKDTAPTPGLIIPRHDPIDEICTLITSPAIYDAQTVVCLYVDGQLHQARLTRLIEETGSFSHFKFELIQ